MDCLAALEAEAACVGLEALVVDHVGPSLRDAVARRHPWVRIIPADPGTTIPTSGAWPSRRRRRRWWPSSKIMCKCLQGGRQQMLEAQGAKRTSRRRLGGERGHRIGWSTGPRFCASPATCSPPVRRTRPGRHGNNASYRRELLERFRDATGSGRWEHAPHEVLRRTWDQLHLPPGDRRRAQEALHDRGGHDAAIPLRAFVRRRPCGRPLDRCPPGVCCVGRRLLPPLLFSRIVARVWSRPPLRPLLLALLAAFLAAVRRRRGLRRRSGRAVARSRRLLGRVCCRAPPAARAASVSLRGSTSS